MRIDENPMQFADWTFGHLKDLDDLELSGTKFKKQTIYVGNHPYKGDSFDVDEDLIDHWVDTGNAMLSEGHEIPLTAHHTHSRDFDRGLVRKFSKGKDSQGRTSLFLSGDANSDEVVEKMKTTGISLFSPVVAKIGQKYRARPILHACMTDTPVVKGMDGFQLALSYPGAFILEDDTDTECPKCKARAERMKKRKKKDKSRRVLALSLSHDEVDSAIQEMIKATGERVAVVDGEKGTLILAESKLEDGMEARLMVGVV